MIAYVKGTLVNVEESGIIVETGGIGYNIMVPLSVINSLPMIGDTVCIHTYMSVREDDVSLFGFLDRDELVMFKKLITVNGVGPKAALGVLSVLTADDLRFAILSEDVGAIVGAPGIGAKTARKIILELKDKVDLEESFEKKLSKTIDKKNQAANNVSDEKNDMINEAIQALVALGYSQSEAAKGVRSVEITDDYDVSRLLKEGLKNI